MATPPAFLPPQLCCIEKTGLGIRCPPPSPKKKTSFFSTVSCALPHPPRYHSIPAHPSIHLFTGAYSATRQSVFFKGIPNADVILGAGHFHPEAQKPKKFQNLAESFRAVRTVSEPCGQFQNRPESFRTVRTVSELSGQFQNCPDSFRTVQTVLEPSGQFWNHLESFPTGCTVLKPFGQFYIR